MLFKLILINWFKKQKPLQSMQSMGGGAVGGVMAGGVSEGGPYSISGGTITTPGNGYIMPIIQMNDVTGSGAHVVGSELNDDGVMYSPQESLEIKDIEPLCISLIIL